MEIVERRVMPSYFAPPLKHVAIHELALINHRKPTVGPISVRRGADGSVFEVTSTTRLDAVKRTETGSVLGSTVTSHMSPCIKRLFKGGRMISPLSIGLEMVGKTEFEGYFAVPQTATTETPICASFHVVSGLPRGKDRIVLFNHMSPLAIAEVDVELALGAPPDMTHGTVHLNPPIDEGIYHVGYYSSKHESVVLVSSPIRVSADADGAPRAKRSEERKPHRAIGGTLRELSAPPSPPLPEEFASSSARSPRTRVLVVAVSYLQQLHELKGPINDAEQFARVASKFFFNGKSSHDNLCVMHEEVGDAALTPTAHNLRDRLRWLVEDAQRGDHLVFFYSGGGSCINGVPCLVPLDVDWSTRCITHNETADVLILPMRGRGVSVTVLLDCCFWPSRTEWCRHYLLEKGQLEGNDQHRGWRSLQQHRAWKGVSPSMWRSIAPPVGMLEEDFTAASPIAKRNVPHSFSKARPPLAELDGEPRRPPSQQDRAPKPQCVVTPSSMPAGYTWAKEGGYYRGLLVDPHTLTDAQEGSDFFVAFEACRGGYGEPMGALDEFIGGKTVGVFSHYLCDVLSAEADACAAHAEQHGGSARRPMAWFELHERVCRAMSDPTIPQQPKLLVSKGSVMVFPVRAAGFVEAE